jgi:hypoxanthine phosphoribosyltransferase
VLKERVLTRAQIETAIETLAARLNVDLVDRKPVFVCVLKGAVYFFTELTARLERSVVIDFIQVSSYGATTESSGTVTLLKDLTVDISGKDVFVVEDIVDTGLTLVDVIALLEARHPASVRVVTLLSKPARRQKDVPIHYVGIEIPDRFVVGFGLDFAEHFRNLPEIWEYLPDQEA